MPNCLLTTVEELLLYKYLLINSYVPVPAVVTRDSAKYKMDKIPIFKEFTV